MTNKDRNLLFGILALQMDFISREALVAAMQSWLLCKEKLLGEILVEQNALANSRRELLEALVNEHLQQHNDDPAQSLAAVSSIGPVEIGPVKVELERLGDADINATLGCLAAARTLKPDNWATRAPSASETTTAGARFRIVRPHAEGGLGVVSVARDMELRREVALKEIKPRHADHPESRARFLMEAEITGGLEHPGIVPVYGLGQYADGRPYYAMRFIRGDSLKEAVDRYHSAESRKLGVGERSVELRKLLGRFLDVCNAIAYAHSRGVLHRDLKPQNVMLGQYGETLVVDWGLAKPHDRPDISSSGTEAPLKPLSGGGSSETKMGTALGTPQYMSPEQAAGRLDRLGPASDVYSLGATLYYVLTGRPPIEGEEIGEILKKVERGEFQPPRAVKAEIARPLEAICLKAMALRPEDRYESPKALSDELERWLADEAVTAYRDPFSARLSRVARRHKVAAAAVSALLVAAVVGLSVGTLLLRREQSRTESAKDDALANLKKAEAAHTEAVANLAAANAAFDTLNNVIFDIQRKLRTVPGAQEVQRGLLEAAMKDLEKLAADNHEARSDRNSMAVLAALNGLGAVYLQVGDEKGGHGAETARRLFERAKTIAQRLVEANPGNIQAQRYLAMSCDQLGRVTAKIGDTPGALKYYTESTEIRRRLVAADRRDSQAEHDLSTSFTNLGNVTLEMGDTASARKYFEQGVQIRLRLAHADPRNLRASRDLSESYERLGDVTLKMGDAAAARTHYQQELSARQRLADADPGPQAQRDLSEAYGKLGVVALKMGDVTAARKYYKQEQEKYLRLTQADPRDIQVRRLLSMSFGKLGDVTLLMGDTAAARKHFRQGLDIFQQLAQADSGNAEAQRDLSESRAKLGHVSLLMSDTASAQEFCSTSLEIVRPLAQADPGNARTQCDLSITFRYMGDVSLETGKVETAQEYFDKSRKIIERLAKGDPDDATYQRHLSSTYEGLADAKIRLGQAAAALKLYNDSLDIRNRLVQKDPHDFWARYFKSLTIEKLADATLKSDRPAAIKFYNDSLDIRKQLAQTDRTNAKSQNDLAEIYRKLGDAYKLAANFAEARRSYQLALEQWTSMVKNGKMPESSGGIAKVKSGIAECDVAIKKTGS